VPPISAERIYMRIDLNIKTSYIAKIATGIVTLEYVSMNESWRKKITTVSMSYLLKKTIQPPSSSALLVIICPPRHHLPSSSSSAEADDPGFYKRKFFYFIFSELIHR
jgi:hypothetical protein